MCKSINKLAVFFGVFGVLFSLVFIPDKSLAAGTCVCAMSVSGGCTMNGTVSFDLDSTFTLGSVVDRVNVGSCGLAVTAMRSLYSQELSRSVVLNEQTCGNQIISGSQDVPTLGTFIYSLSCSLNGASQPSASEPTADQDAEQPNVSSVVSALGGLNQFPGTSIQTLVGRAIQFASLGIMGSVALAMFIYAGLLWMFSRGNSEQDKKALMIMLWTSIGVAVTLASYSILKFIFGAVG